MDAHSAVSFQANTSDAQGDDRTLAVDFPEANKRKDVALAIMSAARSHQSLGITLREAKWTSNSEGA